MKKDTLLLLLVGVGLYLYFKKKSVDTIQYPTAPNPPVANPVAPTNDTGVPIVQTLDANAVAVDNSYRAHFSLSGTKKYKLGQIPNTI